MISPKHAILFCAASLSTLTFLAGCKSSTTKTPEVHAPASPTNAVQPAISQPTLPPDSANNMASNILAWDAVEKEYRAKPGETNAPFTFSLTNVSPEAVVIYDTSTSCNCTVASLPSRPWTIPSSGTGQIHAAIDLRNKVGAVTNHVIVFTSKGNRRLNVKAVVSDK